jgi:hypothetical protein
MADLLATFSRRFASLPAHIGKVLWGDKQACGNDGVERAGDGRDDTFPFGQQEEAECSNQL